MCAHAGCRGPRHSDGGLPVWYGLRGSIIGRIAAVQQRHGLNRGDCRPALYTIGPDLRCKRNAHQNAASACTARLFTPDLHSLFSQARTRAGAPDGQVALGSPGVTVLPGAVTPDGMLALNPAVGALSSQGGAVRMPSQVVTSLEAAQRKVPHYCTPTCRHYMACSLIVRSRVRDMTTSEPNPHVTCWHSRSRSCM